MIELTTGQVIELIEGVVSDFGEDYVYEKFDGHSCHYTTEQEHPNGGSMLAPSCLVGQVLVRAGVRVEELVPLEGQTAVAVIENGLRHAITMPHGATRALREAQAAQDGGMTWGQALQTFRESLGLVTP